MTAATTMTTHARLVARPNRVSIFRSLTTPVTHGPSPTPTTDTAARKMAFTPPRIGSGVSGCNPISADAAAMPLLATSRLRHASVIGSQVVVINQKAASTETAKAPAMTGAGPDAFMRSSPNSHPAVKWPAGAATSTTPPIAIAA